MLVATLPPYVGHRRDIAEHPAVDALRFNTIMPIADSRDMVVRQLRELCGQKPLWIDLKGRQLRIARFAYLPHALVELSHRIQVDTPTEILFKDCASEIRRVVDGRRLLLAERPARVVGEGEPVNILDPSLRIEGYLTESDVGYIESARAQGLHRYMLSFVEDASDIEAVLALDPGAELIAKIESQRGLRFVHDQYPSLAGRVRLMAARDDLYINMGADKPKIFDALRLILDRDPQAYVASRLLTSLEDAEHPSLGDLSDLELMRRMGFGAFMLSDGLCFRKAAFQRAMAALQGAGVSGARPR